MEITVLDAGVVIALLNAEDAHHDAARRTFESARRSGDRLVLPVSAYAEALVGPMRLGASSGEVVDAFLDALPAVVHPADRMIARNAASIRAEHARVRLPDALVIATAIAVHADRILTTDAGWPEIGVRVDVVR